MKHAHFTLFLFLGTICQGAYSLEVNYKTVEVLGTGDTRSDAIQWAQINAIQLVTGSNYSVSQSIESTLSSSDGVSKTGSSSSLNISKETAGIIRSSKIKSTIYNKQFNEWNAVLSVTVLDLDRSTGRKSISVSNLKADKRDLKKFAGHITSSIKSKLTASRKFLVVEQNLGKKFTRELEGILENPLLPLSEKIIVDKGLPSELIVIGKVESASFEIKKIALSPDFRPVLVPSASISVNYQIIDVLTSETKFYDITNVDLKNSDFLKSQTPVTNENIASLSAEIVGARMVEKILDAIYPAVITSVSDENLVSLNYGADFYKEGDQLSIYRRGDRIYDPYTKEFISWDERLIGKATVRRTLPKLSFGTLEATEEDLILIRGELSDKSRQFVAYKISAPQRTTRVKKGKINKKMRQREEKIEKEF